MADKDGKDDSRAEFAKNIWLAGLGAYGKAFDAASDHVASATTAAKDMPKLFNELVEKGAELEQQTLDQLNASIPKPKIPTANFSLPKVSIEERIEKMKGKLGIPDGEKTEVETLREKISELTKTVEKLASSVKKEIKKEGKKS